MKNKCASMLLASLCLGVLLTGCGKAPDSGENTAPVQAAKPVSYTHLDVYKRQNQPLLGIFT